jgi:hypothetical protein
MSKKERGQRFREQGYDEIGFVGVVGFHLCREVDDRTFCRRCDKPVGRVVEGRHHIKGHAQPSGQFDCPNCGTRQAVGSLTDTVRDP